MTVYRLRCTKSEELQKNTKVKTIGNFFQRLNQLKVHSMICLRYLRIVKPLCCCLNPPNSSDTNCFTSRTLDKCCRF